jgi:hypothetical protein
MKQLPQDEKEWLDFIRKNRPMPPATVNNLEEQLMQAIAISKQTVKRRKLWIFPSAIAASLLMALGGYHFLSISQDSTNYASLESFMENNWKEIVGEVPASSPSNNSAEDWMLDENTTQ